MNQLSYYVTKRLIVGSKDSSGTIIHSDKTNSTKSLFDLISSVFSSINIIYLVFVLGGGCNHSFLIAEEKRKMPISLFLQTTTSLFQFPPTSNSGPPKLILRP